VEIYSRKTETGLCKKEGGDPEFKEAPILDGERSGINLTTFRGKRDGEVLEEPGSQVKKKREKIVEDDSPEKAGTAAVKARGQHKCE